MHKSQNMKKIIIATAISVFTLTSTQTSFAQEPSAGTFVYSKSSRVVDPATSESSKVLAPTEVNVVAVRDFSKRYNNARNVVWVGNKNGSSVYFNQAGIKMRATYDRKGREEYTLAYLTESQMTPALRHQVKRTYYDYQIDLVTEIKRNDVVSYLVKMQNDNEHVSIRIVEGEIVPFERIAKVK